MVSSEVVEEILRDRLSSLVPIHWIDRIVEDIKEKDDGGQLKLELDK